MGFKIGFTTAKEKELCEVTRSRAVQAEATPRKSVVQIYFSARDMTLAYYNDRFDLKRGDLVYVDGKLEGLIGQVREVNYNFKIKLSDYKRVVAMVDTEVHGRFYLAGSHFLTFDRNTLPERKVQGWFCAPHHEEDEFVYGSDETSFCLRMLSTMGVSAGVAERGEQYYFENRVCYLCLDGTRGYAIVRGNEHYEVEFQYQNGEISTLTCNCFCSDNCKHEVAVMLQLRELLEIIERRYQEEYARSGYFAGITKSALFQFAIDGRESGSFVL